MTDSPASAAHAFGPLTEDRCTVVIPCYNEVRRLNLEAFEQFFGQDQHRNIHLMFVNDGSTDETLSLLRKFCERFPERAAYLDQQPNQGKAEAVRRGMLHVIATGDSAYTGFWDADLATPLDQIPDLLACLTENARLNMVFGARVKLLGRNIERRMLRHYLGRCFATTASLLLRLPIYDTQCGAKLFRITPELSKVLAEPFRSRWIFDVEILARFLALHKGDRHPLRTEIYEYPLPVWTDVAGSKVSALDFLRAFAELAAIYYRHLAR
jgi:glycosyltransferase involved in cell wall biosynthesis